MLVYWFLPMSLFLGIVTSYEDIRHGKIRNKILTEMLDYLFENMLYEEDFLRFLYHERNTANRKV